MILSNLRQYRVRPTARKPLLDFMTDALVSAGCQIVFASDPTFAPFVITFETSAGERLGIVAYAFLANKTVTKNRPADERSFQIKYGPDDKILHEVWQDPLGVYTTLFLGIDVQDGFFVAVDPEMHNPTRFFIRLEFKDHHADAIKREGWHAWERETRGPRDLLVRERVFDFETLIGGTKDFFLDLVRFERAAVGLSPGDRQLLADGRQLFSTADTSALIAHPLAKEFELSPDQIMELIAGARRLKMAVRGWVAEEKLRDALATTKGITSCRRLDVEGGGDLEVGWQDGPALLVECKNVLRQRTAKGFPKIDFQRTRASKTDPCSRYYARSDFHIVAGCLHAVSELWEFRYITPASLALRSDCPGKLDNRVTIDERWTEDVRVVFETAYAELEEKA